MDGCGRQALVEEIVIEQIYCCLPVAEDERAHRLRCEQEIVRALTLLVVVDRDDVLANVLVRGAGAADANTAVVLCHVLAGHLSRTLREGSAEHQVNMIGVFVGVCWVVSNPSEVAICSLVTYRLHP